MKLEVPNARAGLILFGGLLLAAYQILSLVDGARQREQEQASIIAARQHVAKLAGLVRQSELEQVRALMTPALRDRFPAERLRVFLAELPGGLLPDELAADAGEQGEVTFSRKLDAKPGERRTLRLRLVHAESMWQIADLRIDAHRELIGEGARELQKALERTK